MKRWIRLTVVLLPSLFLTAGILPTAAQEPEREVRAFWVDAFHEGIKTPEQVDQLMEDVRNSPCQYGGRSGSPQGG